MQDYWRSAYVALGSNLSTPVEQVKRAFGLLSMLPDSRLVRLSNFYATAPMGPQDQPPFVNAVAGLLTKLEARPLLDRLLQTERDMGRVRDKRWGPRIIDLDLLWMSGVSVDEPGLTLPHPGVSTRNFVLYPLADIAPALDIPGHGNVLELKTQVAASGISVLESP